MRATEQPGVSLKESSCGWAVLLAVLAAVAMQLSLLTPIAGADDSSLVPAAPDETGAAPDPDSNGTNSKSPTPDPQPDPEVNSQEPVAPPDPPAAGESPGPDVTDPALPPPSESERPDATHVGDPVGPAESSTAATRQIDVTTPTVPEPDASLPAAAGPPLTPVLPPVVPESPARPRRAAAKDSRAGIGMPNVAWGQPGSLVSGVTVHAWGAAVTWRPPPLSLPTPPHSKSPAVATTGDSVEQAPPGRAPHVPHPPGGAVCGGASSCGSASVVMLALIMGIVCLCALLFERLILAPALWRPTRFVSLRERPG